MPRRVDMDKGNAGMARFFLGLRWERVLARYEPAFHGQAEKAEHA
jgi:hypothetical protein